MPAATRKNTAVAQEPLSVEGEAPAAATVDATTGGADAPRRQAPDPAEGSAPAAQQDASAEATQDAAAQPPSGPVAVVFNRPLAMIVNGVGPCAPGETKHVPAPLAARLTAGKTPLFTRATA